MTTERVEMIRQRLTEALEPETLDIEDDSASHAGHASAGGGGHFNVIIVSDRFNGLNLIKRHRMVNDILREELDGNIHALALHTMTMEEWFKKGKAPDSPLCMGGSKSD